MASSSSAAVAMDDFSSIPDLVDLRDQLVIQKTILASLEDTPQLSDADQVGIRRAQKDIADLRRRIRAMELQGTAENPSRLRPIEG